MMPARLRDWFADMANLPLLVGELALAVRAMSSHLAGLQRIVSANRSPTRALATLTVLCERRESFVDGVEARERWTPTALGAECWLHEGEVSEIVLMPQQKVRNFRWFVSGDPCIVCTSFVVGNEHASAALGGLKFGDCGLECWLGNQIRVTVERRRAP